MSAIKLRILILFFFSNHFVFGQVSHFKDAYPALPFDLAKARELGYINCFVWKGVNRYADGDHSGEIWSTTEIPSYQYESYMFISHELDEYKLYDTKGDKMISAEYFYREGLLSAIEYLSYDSLQNKSLDHSIAYFYQKDSTPLQSVTTYPFPNNRLRYLQVFRIDSSDRVRRIKSSLAGYSKDSVSINGLRIGDQKLKVFRYNDSIQKVIEYKDLYNIEIEKTTYLTDDGQLLFETLKNASGNFIELSQFSHEEENKLTKLIFRTFSEQHLKFNLLNDSIALNNELELKYFMQNDKDFFKGLVDRIEYFFFNDEGLPEKYIIEEDQTQTVFEYSFYSD